MSAGRPDDLDMIRVEGPEAAVFLQGQLSQDIDKLGIGDSLPSLLLEPTGKMGFLVDVDRPADAAFTLAIDAGYGGAVVDRLSRFKLRTKATITFRESVGGAEPDELAEAARIQRGRPKMGSEILDGVIPAELGPTVIQAAVSFTKGCYTGQELVARIDSRGGKVPRRLRGIVSREGEPPVEGAAILLDGEPVGTITSAARSASGGAVALGFVKRGVEPPVGATVLVGDEQVGAEIRELPIKPI